MPHIKTLWLVLSFLFVCLKTFSQDGDGVNNANCEEPATVVLFRTFNFFNVGFSYKLFSGDSLLGRIKTHDVLIVETFDQSISFHATTKAPSLNADKKTNFQKRKNIHYPFTLKSGQVYFVKCGFLNQNLFVYPRQPTIKLLKKDELIKYVRKRFLRKKIKTYLYEQWLLEKDLKRYTRKV